MFSFREHGILPRVGKLVFGPCLLHFLLLCVSYVQFISNDLEARDKEK